MSFNSLDFKTPALLISFLIFVNTPPFFIFQIRVSSRVFFVKIPKCQLMENVLEIFVFWSIFWRGDIIQSTVYFLTDFLKYLGVVFLPVLHMSRIFLKTKIMYKV